MKKKKDNQNKAKRLAQMLGSHYLCAPKTEWMNGVIWIYDPQYNIQMDGIKIREKQQQQKQRINRIFGGTIASQNLTGI